MRSHWLLRASLLAVLAFQPASGAAQQTTVGCVPTFEGPVAVTRESPAYHARVVPDLPSGYVDEEYVMACTALGGAYRTSVNVRRPVAPTQPVVVVVEPTHPSNIWPILRWTSRYQQRGGIVAVAVNANPDVVNELVKPFNKARYADLSVPGVAGIEEEILAQFGAAVRLGRFPKINARAVILAGHSFTGGVVRRYIAAHDERARVKGGEPIYQGYLPAQTAVGNLPGPIPDLDVPVVELQGEREVIVTLIRNPAGLGYRRPDGERYRLYEVPGLAHQDARGRVGPNERCVIEKPTQFPMETSYSMALRNLVEWVRDRTPAPRADRIKLQADGKTIARDEHGNALGGVRNPYVDVPVATYLTVSEQRPGTTGGSCDMNGPQFDLSSAALHEMYGTKDAYIKRLRQRLDELVAGRWYMDFHAEDALAEAKALRPF